MGSKIGRELLGFDRISDHDVDRRDVLHKFEGTRSVT